MGKTFPCSAHANWTRFSSFEDTAEFTPASLSSDFVKIVSTRPRPCLAALTSKPPAAPGLTADSVWVKSSTGLKPIFLRPVAETTPQLKLIPKPKLLLAALAWLPTAGVSRIKAQAAKQKAALEVPNLWLDPMPEARHQLAFHRDFEFQH